MNLEPLHLAALLGGLLVAAVLLGLFVRRRARQVDPVYCIHCWVHNKRITIVTHTAEGRRWAICQECVGVYWDFDDEE